ncbi:MAG: S1/P1 nuclease [Prevotella sp.]|nr:S1/P1 nuclease [Prevotella sp.]MCM1075354.1 S1/P1 nuclease [Ruminococcus sp.]
MKKIQTLVAAVCAVIFTLPAFGWGQKGHDTVVHIAERHLTPRTAAAIDSLLKGQSLVYWANWLDNASHTPEYDYSRTWHYKNIDADETYDKSFVNPKGDILRAIDEQSAKLGKGDENEALALKMVIHLMGDLHQPMHMGRYKDRGGNNHNIKFFERDTNLHSVWDTNLVETGHKWSYSEWAEQIDRAPEDLQSLLIEGTVTDWGRETYEIAKEIYSTTPEGTVVSYDYIANWMPVIEQQFLKGGLRLAHILNSAYDPAYNK